MGKHSKPSTFPVRRVIASAVFAPASLGLASTFAAPAFADAPTFKGQCSPCEKVTGKPEYAVGTVSQFALAFNSDDVPGGMGTQHTSEFAPGQDQDKPTNGGATGRLGVGNVARIDSSFGEDPSFDGDDPNSHFAGQTTMDGIDTTDPSLPPGNNDNPTRNNPNG